MVPLRRVVPAIGRLDTAAVVLMLALEILGVWVVSRLGSTAAGPAQIVLFSVTKLLATLLMTYFFLIIAAVILSWVGQQPAAPGHSARLPADRTGPAADPQSHPADRRH